jgi:hypothetical protein
MLTPYVPNFSLLSCIHKITDGDLELKILTERKMNSLTHIRKTGFSYISSVEQDFIVCNILKKYIILIRLE